MNRCKILLIDDEVSLRELIQRLLELEGYSVVTAENLSAGTETIRNNDFEIIISDVRLPDGSGLDLIPFIKQYSPQTEIIMLTAYGKIEDGVKAIKEGAFDYIVKGDEDNKLLPVVKNACDKVRMSKRITRLEKSVSKEFTFDNITGNSLLLKEAVSIAKRSANSVSPILLSGETGTGKEIFARSIHYESDRRNESFVAVNCSSFAKELLESEMFGYKAGAFTGAVKNKKGLFEEADKGTLFLDEIGEMDLTLQAKLLRVIENNTFIKQGDTKETKVDVRIIAATNKDLIKSVQEGQFRKDLFYRISVIRINLPPLRDRKEDIPLLAEEFISEFSVNMNKPIPVIDAGFFNALTKYDFPGNIRELKNAMERIMLLNDKGRLSEQDLPPEFFLNKQAIGNDNSLSLDFLEKKHILDVLRAVKFSKTDAAKILGIGLTTLYRKLKEYDIQDDEET